MLPSFDWLLSVTIVPLIIITIIIYINKIITVFIPFHKIQKKKLYCNCKKVLKSVQFYDITQY